MSHTDNSRLLLANAVIMGGMAVVALWLGRWPIAFVAAATVILSVTPVFLASRLSIDLPRAYLLATTLFIFASIFLGEAFDFYDTFWWWDLVLHGSSAVGFGLLGFLFVFMLFEGDRYAAPPLALGVLTACVAVTIGALWEIFEFVMDAAFGFNMQKSGLVDTMTDIVLNMVGAAIAGVSGYLYLIGRGKGGLSPMIDIFIEKNKTLYRKSRDRMRR